MNKHLISLSAGTLALCSALMPGVSLAQAYYGSNNYPNYGYGSNNGYYPYQNYGYAGYGCGTSACGTNTYPYYGGYNSYYEYQVYASYGYGSSYQSYPGYGYGGYYGGYSPYTSDEWGNKNNWDGNRTGWQEGLNDNSNNGNWRGAPWSHSGYNQD